MSEISGSGYGDSHDWENKGTEQMPLPTDRSTLWVCRKCGVMFRHYYNIVTNIFDAMKERKVPEFCDNKNRLIDQIVKSSEKLIDIIQELRKEEGKLDSIYDETERKLKLGLELLKASKNGKCE